MQKITVINRGKRYLVNVPTEEGVGSGFAVGQFVLKSYTDNYWYLVFASGSSGNVDVYVSQSQLASYGTSSYFDINYPYQILGATDGKAYQIYLEGTAPTASVTVSQSAIWNNSYITNSQNAIIDLAKPYLILQNISNFHYYKAYLSVSASVVTLEVDQAIISSSWIHPIY